MHVGLKECITYLLNYCTFDSSVILVYIHIDGIPLWKSRKLELIPILGKIINSQIEEPFSIGCYLGPEKAPDINEVLLKFVTEYNQLNVEGFSFNNVHYTVQIKAVIADTMARNWVMTNPNHNSYYGCQKCTQKGERKAGRMLFLNLNAPLKTDNNFRQNLPDFFKNICSPLEWIGVGIVSEIPLDPMHLLYLGIAKKLLKLWTTEFGKGAAAQELNNIFSENYIKLAKCVPLEFARKPRGINELDHWKATEFRLFLLYLGPVVLRTYLNEPRIIHFNALNCAIRILSDSEKCYQYNSYANSLLRYFVEQMSVLYGEETIIFNVHNLIHLAADVLQFGPLDGFSAFPFENYLQLIKNMVRNCSSPLAQIRRRIEEKKIIPPKIKLTKKSFQLPPEIFASENVQPGTSTCQEELLENFIMSPTQSTQSIQLKTMKPLSDISNGQKNSSQSAGLECNLNYIQIKGTDGELINFPIYQNISQTTKELGQILVNQTNVNEIIEPSMNDETPASKEEIINNQTLHPNNFASNNNRMTLQDSEQDEDSNDQDNHSTTDQDEISEREWHPCCRKIYECIQSQSQALENLSSKVSNLNTNIHVLKEMVMNRPNGEVGEERLNQRNLLPNFPLKSVDEFENFNADLEINEDMCKQYKSFIISIGGNKIEKMIRNTLSNTLSNDVGCSYNWTGTRGGKKMKNKYFATVILDTFKNKQGATTSEIEEIFKDWLRRSSDRKNNEKKKNNAANEARQEV